MKSTLNYQWRLAVGAIGIAAALMAGCATVPPPTEQLAVSKAAMANAVAAGGPEFAPMEMRTAQEKMDSANQAMAAKEYERAQWMAEQAQVDAQLAASKAQAAKAQKAVLAAQEDSRVLREELDRKNK
jgi:septal ring factor EnvC (AmiA/AmiB activator)